MREHDTRLSSVCLPPRCYIHLALSILLSLIRGQRPWICSTDCTLARARPAASSWCFRQCGDHGSAAEGVVLGKAIGDVNCIFQPHALTSPLPNRPARVRPEFHSASVARASGSDEECFVSTEASLPVKHQFRMPARDAPHHQGSTW